MNLKLIKFIREASERQLVEMCLYLITQHEEEAVGFISEEAEPGIDITPKDVASLPRTIFISNEKLAEFQAEYARGAHGDNVNVIRQLRNLFNIGLKEAVDTVRWMVANNHLRTDTNSVYGSPPAAAPGRF